MSYYILPKIINNINVNPEASNEKEFPYISFSLLNYYNIVQNQLIEMFYNSNELNNTYDESIRIINPYEYIYTKVPGSKFSVSKLKPNSNLFYDLIEIFNNLNIFEQFKFKNISSLIVSKNCNDINDCQDIFREEFNDNKICLTSYNIDDQIINYEVKFDFIFFETDDNYFISIIKFLILIFKNQSIGGTSIIKLNNLFYKPTIDMLYLLSSLFDKVYISKPNTNNITTFDKYIVCKNFVINEQSADYLNLNYYRLLIFMKKLENRNIKQILNIEIPYYFKMKINDLNIVMGQQQIESLDQIITIFKNKNKDEKIENIKKTNIQKSVTWCEKYKIPCNKFTEKTNIFLPIINETI
jgi:hypothetical protein